MRYQDGVSRIAAGVAFVYIVRRLVLPGNETAEVINSIGKGYSNLIKASMGIDPDFVRCSAVCYYPSVNGGWTILECPLEKGHLDLVTDPFKKTKIPVHYDENYAIPFTDKDAEWMHEQYKTWRGE